jgi:hypothetical protein
MPKSFSVFSMLVLSLLLACTNAVDKKVVVKPEPTPEPVTTEYKQYYFPVDSLAEAKVYHYSSLEGNPDMYWVLSTITENGLTYMLTNSYSLNEDGTFKAVENIKEEIKKDGAYITAYTEFQKDHNGITFPAVATMNSDCVFKWSLKTTEPLIWSFETTNENNPDFLQKLSKTRNYTGNKVNVFFEDDSIQAIEFKDNFHMEMMNTSNGRNRTYDFSQTSYYAQHIGMYKYIREFEGIIYSYELVEILSEEEWLKIFKIGE